MIGTPAVILIAADPCCCLSLASVPFEKERCGSDWKRVLAVPCMETWIVLAGKGR